MKVVKQLLFSAYKTEDVGVSVSMTDCEIGLYARDCTEPVTLSKTEECKFTLIVYCFFLNKSWWVSKRSYLL